MVQAFLEASVSSELHKKFPVVLKNKGLLCSLKRVIRFCHDLQNLVHICSYTLRVCQTIASLGVRETQFGV
jgi:hypothetical protein